MGRAIFSLLMRLGLCLALLGGTVAVPCARTAESLLSDANAEGTLEIDYSRSALRRRDAAELLHIRGQTPCLALKRSQESLKLGTLCSDTRSGHLQPGHRLANGCCAPLLT